MNSKIEVIELIDRKDLKSFIKFPFYLYKNDSKLQMNLKQFPGIKIMLMTLVKLTFFFLKNRERLLDELVVY
jgi:hypothetical protein